MAPIARRGSLASSNVAAATSVLSLGEMNSHRRHAPVLTIFRLTVRSATVVVIARLCLSPADGQRGKNLNRNTENAAVSLSKRVASFVFFEIEHHPPGLPIVVRSSGYCCRTCAN